MWNLKRGLIAIGIIVIIAGGIVFLLNRSPAPEAGISPDEASLINKYPLLARRILLDEPNDSIVNFADLRKTINTYFTDNKLGGSFYFEYLPTGTSIRVGGDEEQIAASLMKLPAAMDLYKANELGRMSIDEGIVMKEEWLDSGYGTLYKKGAGYKITLRDATKIMLEDSDNTALKAVGTSILNILKPEESSLSAVDVDVTQNPDLTVSISARSYSSLLKCLYFSCYLNHDNSEEILNYLTNTKFDNRLVAGIDNKDIKIAHKIGVASQKTQSDCGIVYLPKRNYTLCVFINGRDSAETDKHIADISKKVYEFVTKK